MSQANYRVHWPGEDVDVCLKHKEMLERTAQAMGFGYVAYTLLEVPTTCKNCENEAAKRDGRML